MHASSGTDDVSTWVPQRFVVVLAALQHMQPLRAHSQCGERRAVCDTVAPAAQGEEWKKTTLKTALLFPGVVFAIFFMLNLLVWGQRSSGAVPFGTLFALCFLWFGISVPLVFIGSYFGYKKPAPEVRLHMLLLCQLVSASVDATLNLLTLARCRSYRLAPNAPAGLKAIFKCRCCFGGFCYTSRQRAAS